MTRPPDQPESRGTVVCVGEALIDLFTSPASSIPVDSLSPRVGGAPANMAVAIARLGGDSRFLGCLGDDAPGAWIRDRLRREGVDMSLLRTVPDAQTRLALVTGPADARDFTFYGDPPADTLLSPNELDPDVLTAASAVILSSLGLTREPSRSALHRIAEICQEHRVPVVFDPNPRRKTWPDPDEALQLMRPIIQSASLLKMGEQEPGLLGLSPEQLRALQPGDSCLVLTDGPRGCRYWYGDRGPVRVPALPVQEIDSTGAGDAFTAGLTLRFIASDYRISYADIEFASAVGALTTGGEGAMDALPCREAVETLLKQARSAS